jgi:hypothetical protein
MNRGYTSSPPCASIGVLWDCFNFTLALWWVGEQVSLDIRRAILKISLLEMLLYMLQDEH